MVNFIVASNKDNIFNKYKNVIDRVLMKWDINYKCYKFYDNNKTMECYIYNKSEYNVFIIDAETVNNIESMIDEIRNKQEDYISFIIIIDFNNVIERKVLKGYDFHSRIITKKEHFNNKLFNCLDAILNILNQAKQNIIVKNNGSILKIPYSDILYIEKESNSKNCIFVCNNKHYHVNKTITSLEENLKEGFIKTHRSALINKENLEYIDFANNKIHFKNGKECSLISRSNKKEVKRRLTEKGFETTK